MGLHYITLLAYIGCLRCNALTYAIDAATCSGPRNLDRAMQETQAMANTAWMKLGANDEVIAQAFRLVFKVELSDLEAKRQVSGEQAHSYNRYRSKSNNR